MTAICKEMVKIIKNSSLPHYYYHTLKYIIYIVVNFPYQPTDITQYVFHYLNTLITTTTQQIISHVN